MATNTQGITHPTKDVDQRGDLFFGEGRDFFPFPMVAKSGSEERKFFS